MNDRIMIIELEPNCSIAFKQLSNLADGVVMNNCTRHIVLPYLPRRRVYFQLRLLTEGFEVQEKTVTTG